MLVNKLNIHYENYFRVVIKEGDKVKFYQEFEKIEQAQKTFNILHNAFLENCGAIDIDYTNTKILLINSIAYLDCESTGAKAQAVEHIKLLSIDFDELTKENAPKRARG